jgi:hypothetical protein
LDVKSLIATQIAAQLVLRSEDHHLDRRKSPVECTRDLGVTHSLVIAQHQHNLVAFWQSSQLFSHLLLFFAPQNSGKWRRSRLVRNSAKFGANHARVPFALAVPQLVNAMSACYLRHPSSEGRCLVSFLQDLMQLQKDLGRRILSVFALPKEPAADLENVAIVGHVDCA